MKTLAPLALAGAVIITAADAAAELPEFVAETIDDDVEIGYGLAIADVNGDGQHDILLADKTEIVWYSNPDWERSVIAKRLTLADNVCIAARDVDGDDRAEIAVGAQWNPGETTNPDESGAVFFLARPPEESAGELWTPVELPHDPTVHRMHWVQLHDGGFALAVLPLHGIGNQGGAGENTVQLSLHRAPLENRGDADRWKTEKIDTQLHMAHNFDVIEGLPENLLVAGREGFAIVDPNMPSDEAVRIVTPEGFGGAGEIRRRGSLVTAIEPMHGNVVAVYDAADDDGSLALSDRAVLDESLNQGHALAVGDLNRDGSDEIVAGWRGENQDGKVGIRIFSRGEDGNWSPAPLDDDTMAAEDLKLSDLDGDGDLDVIAAGRATKNLVIYQNQLRSRENDETDEKDENPAQN